jgi:metal-responsive CopG/Arc/MetJ family transcriptional regulator
MRINKQKSRLILQARTFLLDAQLVQELEKLPYGERSKFVREAIREKLERARRLASSAPSA